MSCYDPSKRLAVLICVSLLLHSTKCSNDPYQTAFGANYDDYQRDPYQTLFRDEHGSHNEIEHDAGNWIFYPDLDRQGQPQQQAQNAASDAANEVAAGEEDGKGRNNKEPVTGNFIVSLTRLLNPQLAQAFLINQFIAYLATQVTWLTLHFLFWDYSTTRPNEELTATNFLTAISNPDITLYQLMLLWALTLSYSIVVLIPVLSLNLFPTIGTSFAALFGETFPPPAAAGRRRRRRKRSNFSSWFKKPKSISRKSPTFTEADLGLSLRGLLCPACVARVIFFNTLVMVGNALVWLSLPYLRGPLTGLMTATAAAGKKKRKRRQIEFVEDDEEIRKMELEEELQDILIQAFANYSED